MADSLRVDPTELHLTAGHLDGHANDFRTAHQEAHGQADRVVLGSGAASAALPQMLGAWEDDTMKFSQRHTKHADDHREAAGRYVRTDAHGADEINDAGSTF